MSECTYNFSAIGTQWCIDIFDPFSQEEQERIRERIMERIDEFDKNYSRFRPDSLITALSKTPGTFELPADAKSLFDIYLDLYKKTGGAFTPLVGQVLSDAGYDADYSLKPGPLTAPPAWDEVIEYSFPSLTLKKPAMLDFGAGGKGYLVDIIGRLLEEEGVRSFCIDASGDILYRSAGANAQGIQVGLEHPGNANQVIGTVTLSEKYPSICGSAGNRRAWGAYHHIIDPRSLTSVQDIAAVWVVARSALAADALATCLFFVSPDALKGYDFEYVILKRDMSVDHSSGFPGELFIRSAPLQ